MLNDGSIVPGLAFSCRAQTGFEVKLDPREHGKYMWATLDDLSKIDFIDPKMKQIITRLLIAQSRRW